MRTAIFIVTLFVMSMAWATDKVSLKKVDTFSESGSFVAELSFDKSVSTNGVVVDYINQTVQVDIPSAVIGSGKKSTNVKIKPVKSIFVYQANDSTMRARFILENVDAKTFKDAIEVVAEGTTLRIVFHEKPWNKAITASIDSSEKIILTPRPLEDNTQSPKEINDEAIVQASAMLDETTKSNGVKAVDKNLPEQNIANESASSAAKSVLVTDTQKVTPKEDYKNKPENEIPVFADNKILKKSESSPFLRMIMGMLVVVILSIGLFFGSRKWLQKKNSVAKGTKINILTQHHIGPKKSLMIVRVAGETILIGVTDHNISMLKTLSLMDDELSEVADEVEQPKNFSNLLKKKIHEEEPSVRVAGTPDFIDQDDMDDEFSIKGIKDVVVNRLKGMREL